jgi:4-hydroxybenzoyl-CoA thioesterase
MIAWHTTRIVRFGHCDPAGIVYYPRFLDLVHEAKEDWFRVALGWPFAHFIGDLGLGFPIVHLDAEFRVPSRLGDELDVALTVPNLGGSSMHLHYERPGRRQPPLSVRDGVVPLDLSTGNPRRIDDDLRARIQRVHGIPGTPPA